jgi:hypothetical protein
VSEWVSGGVTPRMLNLQTWLSLLPLPRLQWRSFCTQSIGDRTSFRADLNAVKRYFFPLPGTELVNSRFSTPVPVPVANCPGSSTAGSKVIQSVRYLLRRSYMLLWLTIPIISDQFPFTPSAYLQRSVSCPIISVSSFYGTQDSMHLPPLNWRLKHIQFRKIVFFIFI